MIQSAAMFLNLFSKHGYSGTEKYDSFHDIPSPTWFNRDTAVIGLAIDTGKIPQKRVSSYFLLQWHEKVKTSTKYTTEGTCG